MFNGILITFENGLTVGKGGAVKAPSTYKVKTSDIDADTRRSMSGYMSRNRVRGGDTTCYSIEVSWDKLTWEELISLIAAGDEQEFDITFLDAKSKGYKTATFYRDANMEYELTNIFSDEEAYWTTTMSFVGI